MNTTLVTADLDSTDTDATGPGERRLNGLFHSITSVVDLARYVIHRRRKSVLHLTPDDDPDTIRSPEETEDADSNDIVAGSSPDRNPKPETNEEPNVEIIDGQKLAELLTEAGIVTETEAGDDLRLTDQFADVWHRRINRLRDGDRAVQQLALVLEVDPDKLVLEESDGTFIVRLDGNKLGKWPSEPAFSADVALHPTVGEWLPVWEDLDGQSRDELLGRLRAFLKICPACDGDLQAFEEPDSDSDGIEVTLACAECGSVVFNGSY